MDAADYPGLQLLFQGAEAKIYLLDAYAQRDNCRAIVKERFRKAYRHPALDAQLTARRIKAEARNSARARDSGIRAPEVYHVDKRKGLVFMEYVEGQTLKAFLDDASEIENDAKLAASRRLGRILRRMHCARIVHGDLTTSNVLVQTAGTNEQQHPSQRPAAEKELVLIDWGLSSISTLHEDMAVDLYVLERAWTSTHPRLEPLFWQLVDAYGTDLGDTDAADASRDAAELAHAKAVLTRYRSVRARGRKRDMTG